MLLFLLLFPVLTFLRHFFFFYCVCAQTSNSPILTVAISCSCSKSSPRYIPAGVEHISLLCCLHSSSTTWHQPWLLLWPIKCYFMDRRISRSWMTLQSSDPSSKDGFSKNQTISGSAMPKAFSCWNLGWVLEKFLVPALFWVSHDSFTSHYPATDFPTTFPHFWSDYRSNKLNLTC